MAARVKQLFVGGLPSKRHRMNKDVMTRLRPLLRIETSCRYVVCVLLYLACSHSEAPQIPSGWSMLVIIGTAMMLLLSAVCVRHVAS